LPAGVTLEQCRTDLRVQQHAPLLTQVCAVIGALSVRNVGTLGGNLAWRSGDSIAALMVLDAQLQLNDESPVSVSDFLQQQHDDALLLGIAIARRSRHTFFEKAGYREAFTPTLVLICGAFECDANGRLKNVRLAFPVPACARVACRRWKHGWRGVIRRPLIGMPGLIPACAACSRIVPGSACCSARWCKRCCPASYMHAVRS